MNEKWQPTDTNTNMAQMLQLSQQDFKANIIKMLWYIIINMLETNGKIENKVYYNKAQLALKANKTYAEALLQKQELNKVDGISGATLSYKQFFDAAQRALEEAGK